MISTFEWYDVKKLTEYYQRYNRYKQDYDKQPERIKDIVDGVKNVYNDVEEIGQQIIYLSWIDPVEDTLILEMLGISKVKLNQIRTRLLQILAQEIGYI